MDAGSEDWLMYFAYESDYPSFPGTKLAAGDAKWIPGWLLNAEVKMVPRVVATSFPYWYADNANPAGVNLGKAPVDGTFSFTTVLVDAVPAYLLLGKATKDTPSANIWQIQGSTNGAVPVLIAGVENNRLYANQARQFEDVSVAKGSIMAIPVQGPDGKVGNFLAIDFSLIARREYTGVDQNTATLGYRGTNSPELGYNILGNTYANFAFTWNSKTLAKWIVGIKSDVTNDISNVLRMDNELIASIQVNGGHRKYGKPVFKVLQKMTAAGDLDDLEPYRADGGGGAHDIVLQVPRRNNNDWIKITWKNCYLLDVQHEPSPKGSEDKYTTLVFSEPTDIIFNDSQNDGSADPEEDADFEQ